MSRETRGDPITGKITKESGKEWQVTASANVNMTEVCDPACTAGEILEVGCRFGEDRGFPVKTTKVISVIGKSVAWMHIAQ